MKRVLDWIDACARPVPLGLLIAVSALAYPFFAMFDQQMKEITGGPGIPDMALFYTPADLAAMLASYDAAARALYAQFQFYDIFYPLVYPLAMAALTALLWRDRGKRWLALISLAVLPVDYAENIALFIAVHTAPALPHGLAVIAAMLSALKFALAATGLALIVAGLVLRLMRR